MSDFAVVALAILIAAAVIGVASYFVLQRFDRLRETEETFKPTYQIGSYAQIRRLLADGEPVEFEPVEIPLTPENIDLLVETLEGEVNNGGVDQFLFNSSGDHLIETIQALDMIGALKTATILREAGRRFPNGNVPRRVSERRDLMLNEVSPNGEAFGDLDQRFYSGEDDLVSLVDDYRTRTERNENGSTNT